LLEEGGAVYKGTEREKKVGMGGFKGWVEGWKEK
jgi:hypothetical protein